MQVLEMNFGPFRMHEQLQIWQIGRGVIHSLLLQELIHASSFECVILRCTIIVTFSQHMQKEELKSYIAFWILRHSQLG